MDPVDLAVAEIAERYLKVNLEDSKKWILPACMVHNALKAAYLAGAQRVVDKTTENRSEV